MQFILFLFFSFSSSSNSHALGMNDFYCIHAPQAIAFYHNTDKTNPDPNEEGYCSIFAECVHADTDHPDSTQPSEKERVDQTEGSMEKLAVLSKKHGPPLNACVPLTAPTDWFFTYLSCKSNGWVDSMGQTITDENQIARCKKLEHSKILPKPCYRSCPAPKDCKDPDPNHDEEVARINNADGQAILQNPTGIFKAPSAVKAKE